MEPFVISIVIVVILVLLDTRLTVVSTGEIEEMFGKREVVFVLDVDEVYSGFWRFLLKTLLANAREPSVTY